MEHNDTNHFVPCVPRGDMKMRHMKLFVLSSGYVAVVNHHSDLEEWGTSVIPLGFGSEMPAQRAVDIMQKANPSNLVSFAGGLFAYKQYTSRHQER